MKRRTTQLPTTLTHASIQSTVTATPGRSLLTLLALSIALLLLASGCAQPPKPGPVEFVLNPSGKAPLAGVLRVTADGPTSAHLAIFDGETTAEIDYPESEGNAHELLVLGLLPDNQHTVTVTLTDAAGRSTVLEPIEVTTDPLPADFPPVTVPVRRPLEMEPGFVMVPLFRWTEVPGKDDKNWGYIFITDLEGQIRWYTATDGPVAEPRRMRNGNLFYLGGRTGRLFEVDMLGEVIHAWHSRLVKTEFIPEGSVEVATDTLHHDVIELPNRNFLGLSTEARTFDDYPAEYPPGKKKAKHVVIGDVLVEFTRAGEVVKEVKIFDRLDPYRLGHGSLETGFYEDEYSDVLETPGYDWAHSNAIVYIPETNDVLVSTNHLSAHYKIDWETGDLEWIFGDPAGWREPWDSKLLAPEGELQWAYYQHGIERTPQGTWILYDNGGERAMPPNSMLPPDQQFSRVVEFDIDEENKTVRQVWSYGPDQEWFMSPFISDADWLPETGNVLITDGGRFTGPDGKPMTHFGGRNWARVLQVTYGENPEKIWELIVDDPARGYSIYRAQHIKSLYPHLDRPTG